jgi:hypothetical protein
MSLQRQYTPQPAQTPSKRPAWSIAIEDAFSLIGSAGPVRVRR